MNENQKIHYQQFGYYANPLCEYVKHNARNVYKQFPDDITKFCQTLYDNCIIIADELHWAERYKNDMLERYAKRSIKIWLDILYTKKRYKKQENK